MSQLKQKIIALFAAISEKGISYNQETNSNNIHKNNRKNHIIVMSTCKVVIIPSIYICKFTSIISSSASHSSSEGLATLDDAASFLNSIPFSSAAIDAANLN